MSTESQLSSSSVNSNKSGEPPDEEKREVWDSQFHFLLSCIGMSVGLGNIWKFPALAYENGGSAFLFPYITCALVLCLPFIYAEFLIGQYTSAAPSQAFKKYAPAFQGVGWAMALMSATVCVYYTVIVAWAGVYMAWIVAGRMGEWTKCDNYWNTKFCTIPEESLKCAENNSSMRYFMGGNCTNTSTVTVGAAEEFFQLRIIRKSASFTDMGNIHVDVLVSLIVMWVLVAAILIKGIKYMGYAAYVTSTAPYVIVIILFIRGVTLDGATDGLYFYLGNPDWKLLLSIVTWKRAAMQVLFSIGIGFGALITLSSYSKFNHNFHRDALILIGGDTIMSVFGGMAVFSTMGYLAKSQGKHIKDIVQSGTSLAFIVYPEAIGRMPFPELWAFLFFFMIFALGISSEIGMAEVLCTCIYDQFPSTRRKKWIVALATCVLYFIMGSIMATGSGWYWFQIYHNYTATTSVVAIAALEVICLAWVYGPCNALRDIRTMLGPPTNFISFVVGPSSYYWAFVWCTVCPIVTCILTVLSIMREPLEEKNPYTNEKQRYPIIAEVIGWILGVGPLLAIPVFLIKNTINLIKHKKSLWELLRVQPDHRSFERITGARKSETTNEETQMEDSSSTRELLEE